MNAKEVQENLRKIFSRKFGEDNVFSEWRSRSLAKDWLKYGNIYAPRPDVAVGPFNIREGINISDIEREFDRNELLWSSLDVPNIQVNENPRCLIALEIENSNTGKHMLGNILNASLLGKIGIIVTLRDTYYRDALRIYEFLEGAFERRKGRHDPSNVIIRRYDELIELLRT
jgi:hypothetical protein